MRDLLSEISLASARVYIEMDENTYHRIRRLKAADGSYLWNPGYQTGTIAGHQIHIKKPEGANDSFMRMVYLFPDGETRIIEIENPEELF